MANTTQNRANICIDCKKACGGCSWSAADPVTGKLLFEPVPGWTAERVPYSLSTVRGKPRQVFTYIITACPLFEGDERENRHDCKQLSPEQDKWFLENVERILREWADV